MAKSYEVKLNPEPSAIALAQFARHKARRTSPGNPKWYKPQVIRPFVFVPNRAPVYPRLGTGADWHTANKPSHGDPFAGIRADMSTSEYAREYLTAKGVRA